jgi:hypothetical protein
VLFGDGHHIKTLFRSRRLRRSLRLFQTAVVPAGALKLVTDAAQGFLAQLVNFLARLDNFVAGFLDCLLTATPPMTPPAGPRCLASGPGRCAGLASQAGATQATGLHIALGQPLTFRPPTMDISPRRTLMSCGSSSMPVRLRIWPTSVRCGSISVPARQVTRNRIDKKLGPQTQARALCITVSPLGVVTAM